MNFSWLSDEAIAVSASKLLARTFGTTLDRSVPLDLEEIVLFLSETEDLCYDDDADLGMEGGELVLGKTQPLKRRILLSRALKLDVDPGRARFTLAHELGHWVLHRPVFLAKNQELSLFGPSGEEEFEFVGLNRSIFPAGGEVRREEWQANRFAVDLLIDKSVLRAEFVTRFGVPMVARATQEWQYRSRHLRDHARLLASCQLDDRPPLREVFGLSVEAMAIALETRGYAVERPQVL